MDNKEYNEIVVALKKVNDQCSPKYACDGCPFIVKDDIDSETCMFNRNVGEWIIPNFRIY